MADFRVSLETLKNQITEASTYNNVDDKMNKEYTNMRNEILTNYQQKEKLPRSLKTCSTLSQIRSYFQKMAGDYKTRRALIDKEFEDSLDFDYEIIDFEKAVEEIEKKELNILPDEVKKKGREMTVVYYVLYCIENSLRIFIDKRFTEKIGIEYKDKITIPNTIIKSIQSRKDQEAKNAWLSIRGELDFFYMDFKELGDLILNNWDVFKDSFPDQAWIKTKIDELGNCRNLIAHNSYIGEHERNVININYRSIVKQLTK
jgi:hypothetical protein